MHLQSAFAAQHTFTQDAFMWIPFVVHTIYHLLQSGGLCGFDNFHQLFPGIIVAAGNRQEANVKCWIQRLTVRSSRGHVTSLSIIYAKDIIMLIIDILFVDIGVLRWERATCAIGRRSSVTE
jgi:hypothetical protein